MLPEDWLKKYGMLAQLGAVQKEHVRFSRMQAGLLDALLATLPEATCDDAFRRAAEELRSFEGIKPVDPPASFTGTLREYQREGLGWLQFLERFGFGGCLADDMGLGKTVQVLALLAGRALAAEQQERRPTLIVVPRSLVFNWKQEAARFVPSLKVLDHTGLGRDKTGEHFSDWDVILTTYGTLRRDVLLFKDIKFDYGILDEAQIVKNAGTDQAKAVRLLQANHRLMLSGTPIENHLGELWNHFEFLNPGLLGRASVFQLAGAGRNPDPETRSILAKGLRPFILRRTKQQVAKDLPEKT
jgi:SNF2 family DNA or RNA helicase